MPALKYIEPKTRVQLDLSPTEIEQLNWLLEVCDLTTRKELFNNSIALLTWAAKESVDGRVVASIDRGKKHVTELSTPALAKAALFGEKDRTRLRTKEHATV